MVRATTGVAMAAPVLGGTVGTRHGISRMTEGRPTRADGLLGSSAGRRVVPYLCALLQCCRD